MVPTAVQNDKKKHWKSEKLISKQKKSVLLIEWTVFFLKPRLFFEPKWAENRTFETSAESKKIRLFFGAENIYFEV